jgi:hypothetical protein
MAYDARIPLMFQYQRVPQNQQTLADIYKAAADRQIALQDAALRARSSTLASDAAENELQRQKAIQPGVLAELGRESQAMTSPIVPPPIAEANANDPYAAQQSINDERAQLLNREKSMALGMATVPVLAALEKSRMANLDSRGDLAGSQFGLGQKREWETLKPKLDQIMKPPLGGWNPLDGGKADALARAQAAIPAHLQNLPEVKDWFTVAGKEPQNSMVMASVGGRIGTSLMSDFRGERKEYEDKTNGYLNAEGIVKASTFGKSRIGDISLLDQMARAETGSKPTEAQYHEFKSQPGILGKIGALHERVINGRLLNPEDVDAIMEELRSQQAIRHDNFASTINTFNQQARDLGVNTAFVNPGGIYQQVESTWKPTWRREGKEAPKTSGNSPKISTQAEFDALPSGAEYISTKTGRRGRKP